MNRRSLGRVLVTVPVIVFLISFIGGWVRFADSSRFEYYRLAGHGCFESARYIRDTTPARYNFNGKKISNNGYANNYLFCLTQLPVPFFYGAWWPVTVLVFGTGLVLVFSKSKQPNETFSSGV